jgi:hypothetical protein
VPPGAEKDAGAQQAAFIMLRLRLTMAPRLLDWLGGSAGPGQEGREPRSGEIARQIEALITCLRREEWPGSWPAAR